MYIYMYMSLYIYCAFVDQGFEEVFELKDLVLFGCGVYLLPLSLPNRRL